MHMMPQSVNKLGDSFLICRYGGGRRDREGSWKDGKEGERKEKRLRGSTSSDSRKGAQFTAMHGLIYCVRNKCMVFTSQLMVTLNLEQMCQLLSLSL